MMFLEMYGVFPEQIVIFMVTEEMDDPLIFVEDPKRYVRSCLDFTERYYQSIRGRTKPVVSYDKTLQTVPD